MQYDVYAWCINQFMVYLRFVFDVYQVSRLMRTIKLYVEPVDA